MCLLSALSVLYALFVLYLSCPGSLPGLWALLTLRTLRALRALGLPLPPQWRGEDLRPDVDGGDEGGEVYQRRLDAEDEKGQSRSFRGSTAQVHLLRYSYFCKFCIFGVEHIVISENASSYCELS